MTPVRCDEVRELVWTAVDGGRTPDEERLLAEHLAACANCRAAVESARGVAASLAAEPSCAAPAGLRERTLAEWDRSRAATAGARAVPVPQLPQVGRRWQLLVGTVAGLAAAALLAVIWRQQRSSAAPGYELAAAAPESPAAGGAKAVVGDAADERKAAGDGSRGLGGLDELDGFDRAGGLAADPDDADASAEREPSSARSEVPALRDGSGEDSERGEIAAVDVEEPLAPKRKAPAEAEDPRGGTYGRRGRGAPAQPPGSPAGVSGVEATPAATGAAEADAASTAALAEALPRRLAEAESPAAALALLLAQQEAQRHARAQPGAAALLHDMERLLESGDGASPYKDDAPSSEKDASSEAAEGALQKSEEQWRASGSRATAPIVRFLNWTATTALERERLEGWRQRGATADDVLIVDLAAAEWDALASASDASRGFLAGRPSYRELGAAEWCMERLSATKPGDVGGAAEHGGAAPPAGIAGGGGGGAGPDKAPGAPPPASADRSKKQDVAPPPTTAPAPTTGRPDEKARDDGRAAAPPRVRLIIRLRP